MERLNTSLGENKEESNNSQGQRPMIRSITPNGDSTQTGKPVKEDSKNEEEDESLLEKIDSGLKAIDTTGEYLLVTVIALLIGIVIGLLISFL